VATLRQLRNRVASIGNIQKVTNAMRLVAAARVRRAQDAILAARPYAQKLDQVLQQLSASIDADQHPLMAERPVERVAVAVVTADRGLCGGFNSSISRHALAEIQANENVQINLVTVGRKGRDFLRSRGFEIGREFADVFKALAFSRAVEIAEDMTRRFISGEVDRVVVVFSEFISLATQRPITQQLLPIVPKETEGEAQGPDYIFEPEPGRLLDVLVPRHVNFQIWRALLESNAGEQAARMQAMDNATKNAGDLIEELTREMNKVRQTGITLELMDIIGGAEAVA
jgi:F-type H+-transporting ATPase subunit gamma